MTLADIGAGDGLISFRAIDRVGPTLRVILTDISGPMLRHAETLAARRGVLRQCAFYHCGAEFLSGIEPASVDAVTSRAVLAYVADKPAALREFYRILKPGGRISISEPILRDEALAACALRDAVQARTPNDPDQFIPLLHRWKAAQYPDTAEKIAKSPITNYTERDLVEFARASGFRDIHLEFRIDETPSIVTSWSAYIGSSPHPWAPSLGVILADQFTVEERRFFEPLLRAMVEASKFGGISRMAYLTAEKPQA
jgi:ubiquinone/menaquinone biosynthesis C-methylase UbiE